MTSRYTHTLVGTTSGLIDWKDVILACQSQKQKADHNSVVTVMDRVEDDLQSGYSNKEFKNPLDTQEQKQLAGSYYDLIDIWKNANYRLEDIEWYDYYPGEHIDISVQTIFGEIVNAKPLRVFVSELYPGKMVPYHWDIEDYELEWQKLGELVRYVCFIEKPKPGHILILDEHCFYNEPEHNIYQWKDRKNWHAGINVGWEPYYLFHFLGYKS
jgi:hypothetical protein